MRGELEAYGHGLAEKPEIVALSKVDVIDEETLKKQTERLKRAMRTAGPALEEGERRKPPLILSAATRLGVAEALRALASHIDVARALEVTEKAPAWSP